MAPFIAGALIWLACFAYSAQPLGWVAAGLMSTAAAILGVLALRGGNFGRR